MRLTLIEPAAYASFPWKNGRGTTTDIAAVYAAGAAPGDWAAAQWRFGRTTIDAPGPFSDMTGFERHQAVVVGRGLRLRLDDGTQIDESEPFRPVSFAGEAKIVSVLDAGPVDVANLIVRRSFGAGRLDALDPDRPVGASAGIRIVYAPGRDVELRLDDGLVTLPAAHALRLEDAGEIRARSGCGLVATVVARAV
jgi:environmental stress-induced protein Ves